MTKRALLIGCNHTSTPNIVHMRNTLIDAYGYLDSNIYMLYDGSSLQSPTRSSILYLLTQLVAASSEDDILWVHYIGNYPQIQELGLGLNIDQFAINNIIKNAKCQMLLCFDSCYISSQHSLEYSMDCNGVATVDNPNMIADTNIAMIGWCQNSQTSDDSPNNMMNESVGAFTQTLLETLRQNDHNIALLPLYSKLCANLKMKGFAQTLLLSSSVESPVFQFARANANGSPIVGTSTSVKKVVTPYTPKKDFILSGNNSIGTSPVTNPLRGLMDNLIG